ncbi:MAG: transglycosylase domain-containing protein, partial [Maribacter sp.]
MNQKSSFLKRNKTKILKGIGVVSLVIFGLAMLFILSIYAGLFGKLPSKKELSTFEHQTASEVFTADSVLIGKYFLYDRQPVTFQEVPKHLTEALIAIEDERFYEHDGIDFKSLARVGLKTILLGDASSGGGST